MKREKYIIFGGIFVVFLAMCFIFVAYGYSSTRTVGNEQGKKETFTSRTLKITYSDGSEVLSTLNGYFNPGSTLTKTFKISNTGNQVATYSIKLTNVINDFERVNDITFQLTKNDEVVNSGIFPTEDVVILDGENIGIDESVTYILKLNYLNSTENQIIDSGKSISASIVLN